LTGDVVGTLRYMSPEQALGKRSLIDHRTDIYSMGVTLYDILTLEPALPGGDRQELLHQLAFDDPRPLRRVNKAVPADLEMIVLKATAKDPEDRYATAQEMADDLKRFLQDKPLLARRPSVLQRVAKWSRRHKKSLAVATAFLLLATIALGVSTVLIWQEKEQKDKALKRAEENALQADYQRERAESNFRRLRGAASTILTKLQEQKWAKVEGIQNLRQDLAQELINYFENSQCCICPEADSRMEMALAYMLIGNIQDSQAKPKEAQAAYRKAIAVFEQLSQERPRNMTYHHELAMALYIMGSGLHDEGNFAEAATYCHRARDQYEQALKCGADFKVNNNFAWFLATCPETQFRDATRAVKLSRLAVTQYPRNSTLWNTLGVACYRARNWNDAIAALERSMQLNSGGESFDWFFLAMAHWQLGHKDKAHKWYEKAVEQIQKNNHMMESLARYQMEAATLLGIDNAEVFNILQKPPRKK
jgi:tetratricopeptide (TPR) repeat protein